MNEEKTEFLKSQELQPFDDGLDISCGFAAYFWERFLWEHLWVTASLLIIFPSSLLLFKMLKNSHVYNKSKICKESIIEQTFSQFCKFTLKEWCNVVRDNFRLKLSETIQKRKWIG